MVVDYTAQGDSLHLGTPKAFTETRIRSNGNFSMYDVAPDGKRLAGVVDDDSLNGEAVHMEVVFLLNFADELRRRIAGAN